MNQLVNYKIPVFWDNEFRDLDYEVEEFNDPQQVQIWQQQGFVNNFTGAMCDMRKPQPSWNHRFVELFALRGWHNIGTSYYRMDTGTILPTHQDRYRRYVDLHNLHGQEHRIRRAIVFLETWQPGHYAEYQDQPFVSWWAGDVVEWVYDVPHMAANLGVAPRYTLQVTGHV